MPYILKTTAQAIEEKNQPVKSKGELNYYISKAMSEYLQFKGLNYQNISDAIAAAQDAADECKRRILEPYEEYKAQDSVNIDPYKRLLRLLYAITKK